jgi:hypothetical protein
VTRHSGRALKFLLVLLAIGASPLAAQKKWEFGPVKPHLQDAGVRSVYAFAVGAAFMGLGLGIDGINKSNCGAVQCFDGNPVQAGVGFAFLGTLVGGTGPTLRSKCTRSGRAILGIAGAAIGATAAGAIMNVRLFNARNGDPATIRTMGTGLVGLSLGTGIATAIC